MSQNAARQIREAADWWHANRSARDLLASEIARGFDLISSDPGVGTPSTSYPDVIDLRRLHLPRVRYFIYYRAASPDIIEVVALWHTSRGTSPDL